MKYHNFNKTKNFWLSLTNLFLTSVFIYCTIKFIIPVQNFNIKSISDHSLRDLSYRGIYFKCSNKINDNEAFLALDNLLINYNLYKNYNFVKYYTNNNEVLISFHHYSCYSHPNFYIGSFNEVLFNYQFTRKKINNDVSNFTKNDIYGFGFQQRYFNNINLYHKSLAQIYLNKNSLYLNESYKTLNLNLINNDTSKNVEVQNYICLNCDGLNKIVKKSLNIKSS